MNRICASIIVWLMLCSVSNGIYYQTNDDIKCFVYPSVVSDVDNRWNAYKDKVVIRSARGEYESVQIACWPERNFKNVKFRFEFNKDDIGISGSNSKRVSAKCMDIEFHKLARFGKWDDALVPVKSISLRAGYKSVVWMTVYVDRACPAGKYAGKVLLVYGDKTIKIPVTIVVWDFVIPRCSSIAAIFGIFDNHLAEYYRDIKQGSERWRALLADWYSLISRCRISPFFCHWRRWGYVLTYPSPWPVKDVRSKRYIEGANVARFAVPYVDDKQFSEDIAYIKSKGLLKKAYVYFSDEPYNIKLFKKTCKIADRIHKIEPTVKVLATFYCGPKDPPYNGDIFSIPKLLKGCVQIYCMSEWSVYGRKGERFKSMLSNDEEYWLYVCNAPTSPHPNLQLTMSGYQHRAVIWRVWKEQARGFFYWSVNSWRIEKAADGNSKVIKLRKGLPPGDGVLAYPGECFGLHKPIASVRLFRFRDGMEDYEYLHAVEKRFSRVKAEKMMSIIYLSPECFTRDYRDIEKFRSAIISLLQSFKKD